MRISDWSSDVCSSDLCRRCDIGARRVLRHDPSKRAGERLHLIPAMPPRKRNDDVQSLAARCLKEALQAQLIETVVQFLRRRDDPFKRDRRIRIEIEDEPVGMLDVVGPGAQGVQLEQAELDQRNETGQTAEPQKLPPPELSLAHEPRKLYP